MTVKAEQGSRLWRSALQRSVDTVSEYADVAAQKLSAVSDPRARLLRKRRWALRLGLFFGFASVFWVLVTGLLATWSTPVWALLITGLIAAGGAPTAVAAPRRPPKSMVAVPLKTPCVPMTQMAMTKTSSITHSPNKISNISCWISASSHSKNSYSRRCFLVFQLRALSTRFTRRLCNFHQCFFFMVYSPRFSMLKIAANDIARI